MTVAVIHQPEYWPWLGFFDKARRADVLVLLDHVQFDRSSMQHRTRIAGKNGEFWLTIPFVHNFPEAIDEVTIRDQRFRKKHWGSVQGSYGKAPGFATLGPKVEALYAKEWDRVSDISKATIELCCEALDVRPPRVVSSRTMGLTSDKGALVLDICRRVEATTYVAGRTGASYLDHGAFADAGVSIEVQEFAVPAYVERESVPAETLGGLAALDALMHAPAEARGAVHAGGKA